MSQKLLFKFKYLKLELEETEDLNDKYNTEFNRDFQEEIEYLNEITSKNSQKKEDNDQKINVGTNKKDDSNIPQDFKEIYKTMVRSLHPDLKPDNLKEKYEELLKRVTNAYENKEWLEILTIADEENINLPANLEIYNKELEDDLGKIEKEISHIKNKLSWIWGSKLKPSKKNKKEVYSLLNIDAKKFEEWKKNKG
tara:strand:- start:376 stop:963 length:588 start_codon:yes stop_codon:yes gene_type:complete